VQRFVATCCKSFAVAVCYSSQVLMGDDIEAFVAATSQWADDTLELLQRLLQNVANSPQEAKYRRLKLANPKIGTLMEEPGAIDGFQALGWTLSTNGDTLELPAIASLVPLRTVLDRTARSSQPMVSNTGGDAVPWVVTVLRGPLRVKLELPGSATLASLKAAVEQSGPLGRIPRGRQQLLAGYPPRPVPERPTEGGLTTLANLGLRSVMLQDIWEETVSSLRAGTLKFCQLSEVLARPAIRSLAFQDNHGFVLERARALLRTRAAAYAARDEMRAARRCFCSLWPQATYTERIGFCNEVAACWASDDNSEEGDSDDEVSLDFEQLLLEVDRQQVFVSVVDQINAVSPAKLCLPLEVTFRNEAAEDAGGLRREFFNEFGRAMGLAEGLWRQTPGGGLAPAPHMTASSRIPDDSQRKAAYQGCGRIFGMALCQAARPPKQPLLLGLPLARFFIRAVQGDTAEAIQDLQEELRAEQHSSSPDFRASSAFQTRSLRELGLEGQLTFSHACPGGQCVDLVPGGRDIEVTDETKEEWLRLTLRYELVESIEEAAASFRMGVHEVVGGAHLVLLTASELGEAWSGRGVVSDDDLRTWRSRAVISPAVRQQAEWFFELLSVGELRSARGRVLKFVTGSDRWPVDSSGFNFLIEPMDGGDETLPCAMTCGNMLQLPRYSRQQPLCDRLKQAMDWGLEFALA